MIELRDYQATLTDQAREGIRAGVRRQVLVAPTGAGKTVVAAFVQGRAAARGLTTWFTVHRWEIIKRTAETFAAVGIDFGIVADGHLLQPEKPVQICSTATLVNRMDRLPKPAGIVPDEAHHMPAAINQRIAADNEQAWWLGVTATPERLDGRGLKPYFDRMVEGPTPRSLTDRGYLSPYRYYAPGVAEQFGGDGGFNRRDVAEIMGDAKLIGDAVEAWGLRAEGKRTVNFELTRRSSEATVAAFRAHGISAVHVDGDMHPDQRAEAFAGFECGEYLVLSNVQIVGEGVDIPAIECAMLRDPTDSTSKFLQEVGRVGRPVYADGMPRETDGDRMVAIAAGPKPWSTILDFSGNAFRHGMPDDERVWSLEGRKDRIKQTAAMDHVPIRQCPQCYRISPSTVKVCPGCDYEHATVWVSPKIAAGELFELTRQGVSDREAAERTMKAAKKAEERACGTDIAAWIRLGVKRGYRSPKGWALTQIKIRGEYAAKFRRRA